MSARMDHAVGRIGGGLEKRKGQRGTEQRYDRAGEKMKASEEYGRKPECKMVVVEG